MKEPILSLIERANSYVSSIVWGMPMILLILGTGVLMTVRTRAIQLTRAAQVLRLTVIPTLKGITRRQPRRSGAVSPFEAFATAIAGTVGTGNIIGVVSAILTAGPGAVFWMWVSAFFGMATNYAENVLGIYYRRREPSGGYSGGAFYYIAYGVGRQGAAFAAAVFCILASFGMSGVQTNKIAVTVAGAVSDILPLSSVDRTRLIVGVGVAAVTALVILGGIRRIGRVAAMTVPALSVVFILLSTATVLMHLKGVPGVFSMIFSSAFSVRSAGGGILGYTFAQTVRKGMARGVFSNEAGLGSSVIAHSASDTDEPVVQGMWGVFEVFFDTFVICTLTALMFLLTFDTGALCADMEDSAMAMAMFSNNFGGFGTAAFSVMLPLFAFTSVLAWAYYGEKAVGFCFRSLKEIWRPLPVTLFRLCYVLVIAASTCVKSDLVWAIDDTCNGLMAVPNLIALVALSGSVARITENYFDRQRGLKVKPMRSAYPES